MKKALKPEEITPHWYTTDGTPRWEATLREARKEGLLPGVSTMAKVLDKPVITSWSGNMAIDETYDYLVMNITQGLTPTKETTHERVGERMEERKEGPRKLGTASHKLMEQWIRGDFAALANSDNPEALKAVSPVITWVMRHFDITSCLTEHVLVNVDDGYAGTADLVGLYRNNSEIERTKATAIADFKFRNVKPESGGKVRKDGTRAEPKPFYDEDIMQLAALAKARETGPIGNAEMVFSVVGSTNPETSGQLYVKQWSDEERERGLALYELAHQLYRVKNRFPYQAKASQRRR